MYSNESLTGKIKRLQNLAHQPLGVHWVHSAIAELAHQIRATAPDDETARAAAELEEEAARLRGQSFERERVFETALGEKIYRLCERIGYGEPPRTH